MVQQAFVTLFFAVILVAAVYALFDIIRSDLNRGKKKESAKYAFNRDEFSYAKNAKTQLYNWAEDEAFVQEFSQSNESSKIG